MSEFINYERLLNKMKYLGLEGFLENLDTVSKKFNNKEMEFLEALDYLISSQIKYKKTTYIKLQLKSLISILLKL